MSDEVVDLLAERAKRRGVSPATLALARLLHGFLEPQPLILDLEKDERKEEEDEER
jgi:hypothetical protein